MRSRTSAVNREVRKEFRLGSLASTGNGPVEVALRDEISPSLRPSELLPTEPELSGKVPTKTRHRPLNPLYPVPPRAAGP